MTWTLSISIALVMTTAPSWAQQQVAKPAQTERNPESLERRAAAIRLLELGNDFSQQGEFAEAAKAYLNAVKYWWHPGIHYNLAVALYNLDRPVAAYQNFAHALEGDSDLLKPEQRQNAAVYMKRLRKRVATLEISCTEPGASVSLDGQRVLVGPGREAVIVKPGEHEVVATKPGYKILYQSITLQPARVQAFEVTLEKEQPPGTRAATRDKLLLASGVIAAVGLASGVGFGAWADSEYRKSQDYCDEELNCDYEGIAYINSARSYGKVANFSFAVGGLAALGGAVYWFATRPSSTLDSDASPRLVPSLTPEHVGLSMKASF